MKTFLKSYLYFTKSEREGVVVLLLICLLVVIIPYLLPIFFSSPSTKFEDYQADIATFEASKDSMMVEQSKDVELFAFNPNQAGFDDFVALGLSAKLARTILNYRSKGGRFRKVDDFSRIYGLSKADFERLRPYIQLEGNTSNEEIAASKVSVEAIELFFFNPNLATVYDFQRLGLSSKVAQTIVNYRNKGGTFKRPEDFKKVYGLSKEDFKRLESYIQLEVPPLPSNPEDLADKEETTPKLPASYESPSKKNVTLDINTASAAEWQQLRGIGAAYANRIVKFREALGGFASVEQVAETYQLPDSTFQKIKPFLIASTIQRKLAINQADVNVLSAHPYLSKKEAQVLLNYRTQHGNFKSIDDVRKVKILSENTLKKLEPYLVFD